MRVLLVDIDSLMPNLALMKLSAYHKARGDQVHLIQPRKDMWLIPKPDVAYVSCVFSKSTSRVSRIYELLLKMGAEVMVGGYGFDTKLPDEIEHLRPDYDLYHIDYSMGFTSRGCIRSCPFCSIPRTEGEFREHSPIDEFLAPGHRKVLLLDNNFLASPRWRGKLERLRDYKVSICQGLDARLIDRDCAKFLASYPLYDRKFTEKAYYTAWDRLEDENEVLCGVRNLIEVGVRPRSIRPYVLVGFNTSVDQDLYRFNMLRQLGTYPFIMPYDNKPHPLRRWGQRPALFKSYLPQVEPTPV